MQYIIVHKKGLTESLVVLRPGKYVGKDLRFETVPMKCPYDYGSGMIAIIQGPVAIGEAYGVTVVFSFDEAMILSAYLKARDMYEEREMKVFSISFEGDHLVRTEVAPKDIPTFPTLASAYGVASRGSIVMAREALASRSS